MPDSVSKDDMIEFDTSDERIIFEDPVSCSPSPKRGLGDAAELVSEISTPMTPDVQITKNDYELQSTVASPNANDSTHYPELSRSKRMTAGDALQLFWL